jgi:DNA-binding response OmpR family regulator
MVKKVIYNTLSGLYDLIILDVMLPSMNGFEILKKLREEEIESKVIMLTAKSMLEDKLNGLENGANDYLTKPFHIEELLARVNIQLNKTSTSKKKKISYEDIEIDITKSALKNTNNNEEVELVCKELKWL